MHGIMKEAPSDFSLSVTRRGLEHALSLVCLTCLLPEVIILQFQPVTFPIVCVVFYVGISTY